MSAPEVSRIVIVGGDAVRNQGGSALLVDLCFLCTAVTRNDDFLNGVVL